MRAFTWLRSSGTSSFGLIRLVSAAIAYKMTSVCCPCTHSSAALLADCPQVQQERGRGPQVPLFTLTGKQCGHIAEYADIKDYDMS